MKNYFSLNLKKLSLLHSQKKIAIDTQVSPSSITNYINNTSEPSLNFLLQLKKAYDINIDDFLIKELVFSQDREREDLGAGRFVGNYIAYYYDSSAYKGNSTLYSKNAINYGVISVYIDKNSSQNILSTEAAFLLDRKEAEDMLKVLNNFTIPKQIKEFYNDLPDKYRGTLDVSSSHLFINLKNNEKQDQCSMILNNPPSGKSYVGGMATVNSISRGREHMPCVQYLILSRQILNITDGEVYNLLTLDMPDINIDINIEQLINLFKSLYINHNVKELSLTDYQKKRIIEESVKNTLQELIEDNIFRFAKISDMEDDKYYRIIKEEMLND